ncbi:MAG TPA: hypothetical protein VJ464_25260 [Blastocatellia bacterium]|nr:hypothetical protein [Blastocatellia bacterium]
MSAWILDFTDRLTYSKHDEITIEIFLSGNSSIPVAVAAKVDTGSKFCIFQPRYAVVLGFDLQTGLRQSIRTVAGSFTAYGHEITLTAGDMEWDTIVYFAEPESFPINVVGRVGFFDHLQVGLVDYEQLLYLSPYNPA